MSNQNWKSRPGVVFSTNPDFKYQTTVEEEAVTLPPSKQKLIVLIDRRNRGGKQVTVVKGFIGASSDLDSLAKTLKTKCGVGGSVKEGEIIIQGDLRDKIVSILTAAGYVSKRGN
jgi:translation initiation factor 1